MQPKNNCVFRHSFFAKHIVVQNLLRQSQNTHSRITFRLVNLLMSRKKISEKIAQKSAMKSQNCYCPPAQIHIFLLIFDSHSITSSLHTHRPHERMNREWIRHEFAEFVYVPFLITKLPVRATSNQINSILYRSNRYWFWRTHTDSTRPCPTPLDPAFLLPKSLKLKLFARF
jgi:hypothetical protein